MPFAEFETDAANGNLPDFAFIEPCLTLGHADYHPACGRAMGHGVVVPSFDPPSSILGGEAFLSRIYNIYKGMQSSTGANVWNTTLLIGWDEPGGTYDHVPPPAVPPPDPSAPAGQHGFTFDRSGYRVPAIIVSPWVAEGEVFNEEYRHTSLIATLREQWNLGDPFTARDAAARTFSHVFTLDTPRDPKTWPDPDSAPGAQVHAGCPGPRNGRLRVGQGPARRAPRLRAPAQHQDRRAARRPRRRDPTGERDRGAAELDGDVLPQAGSRGPPMPRTTATTATARPRRRAHRHTTADERAAAGRAACAIRPALVAGCLGGGTGPGSRRSRRCSGRPRRGCPSSSRSATAGWSRRRSRSTGAAAAIMAADLADAPRTGLTVQLCGDAHLSNFGAFAAPDRRLVFSINDFDETLPGPFEWDLKRLVASFAVAGRQQGFSAQKRRAIVMAAAGAYRRAMRSFAGMSSLDVWYTRLDVDDIARRFGADAGAKQSRIRRDADKAESKDSLRAIGQAHPGRRRHARSSSTIHRSVAPRGARRTGGGGPLQGRPPTRWCGRTRRRSRTIAGSSSSATGSSTSPARSSAWAASGPGRGSC